MPRGALEVLEYVPRPATVDALPQHHLRKSEDLWSRLRLEHPTLTSCAAAFIVLAAHIGLIAPTVWADGTSRQRQEGFRGDTALQWVVLDDSPRAAPVTAASLPLPRLVAIGAPDISPPLPAVAPPAPSSKDPDSQSEEHSSLGALYGRYVGQIRARVDRAWMRPRIEIAGSRIFQCQVQIDQDRLGRVGQITLLRCNGDVTWRLSVVHAIEAASPLPAPPDPAVFARHIVLNLRAMAYSRGMPAGLYEAAAPPAALDGRRETASQTRNAFQALRQAATAPHSQRALELRIEGSKVEVEPDPQ